MSVDILVKRVREGDTAAFSELVEQHKTLVFSVVLRMVGNREDAEEVAQDTFVAAFQKIREFKGASKFSTWIYKIAYFTSIKHLRKHKQLTSDLNMVEVASEDDSVMDTLHDNQKKEYLTLAISKLRPVDRNLIAMFYLDEMSVKEIQEVTLFSPSNIKVKLMRIRKELNGILSALLKDELDNFKTTKS